VNEISLLTLIRFQVLPAPAATPPSQP